MRKAYALQIASPWPQNADLDYVASLPIPEISEELDRLGELHHEWSLLSQRIYLQHAKGMDVAFFLSLPAAMVYFPFSVLHGVARGDGNPRCVL